MNVKSYKQLYKTSLLICPRIYALPLFTCDLNIAKQAPCYLMLNNLIISLNPQSGELISNCSDCTGVKV